MLPQSLQDAPRVYKGVRVDVHAVELTGRDGQAIRRDLIVHPGAVVILPLLDQDLDQGPATNRKPPADP